MRSIRTRILTAVLTFAAALSVGAELSDAVRLANAAAGIAVTKPGTATVLTSEVRQAVGFAQTTAARTIRRTTA